MLKFIRQLNGSVWDFPESLQWLISLPKGNVKEWGCRGRCFGLWFYNVLPLLSTIHPLKSNCYLPEGVLQSSGFKFCRLPCSCSTQWPHFLEEDPLVAAARSWGAACPAARAAFPAPLSWLRNHLLLVQGKWLKEHVCTRLLCGDWLNSSHLMVSDWLWAPGWGMLQWAGQWCCTVLCEGPCTQQHPPHVRGIPWAFSGTLLGVPYHQCPGVSGNAALWSCSRECLTCHISVPHLAFPATWPGWWCPELWMLGVVLGTNTEGAVEDCILDESSALQIQIYSELGTHLLLFRPFSEQSTDRDCFGSAAFR